MKNTRSIVMLVVAVIAGLTAVFLAASWVREQTRVSAGKVAVAMSDIQLGAKITPEMIRLIDWPTGSVPKGIFNDPDKLNGRVARTSMTRGEPVLESKLAPEGTQGGLSAVVGEGKRAITVRVNDVVGVAGFALPGNFVDIMVNTVEEGAKINEKERSISKIVLEHILVLAVEQEAGRDETKPRVVKAVTLEVTPEQAEKLDLARSVGTLSLVLRNQVDQTPSQTLGATKDNLFNTAASAPVASVSVPAPAPAPVVVKAAPKKPVAKPRRASPPAEPKEKVESSCVEVIRGTSKSVECF